MLMMSLAPLMSAGLAWMFFGEILTGMQLLGVIVTLAGVAWVILRRQSDVTPQSCSKLQGALFGLGAATGQAVGYVLSKQGLADGFSPIAGNSIRMLAAVIVLWALAGIQGKARETLNSMRERPRVLGWLTMAAFTGPVLGATLSLFALQHTQVGVASTLIALPPVFLLPVSWLVFKEKLIGCCWALVPSAEWHYCFNIVHLIQSLPYKVRRRIFTFLRLLSPGPIDTAPPEHVAASTVMSKMGDISATIERARVTKPVTTATNYSIYRMEGRVQTYYFSVQTEIGLEKVKSDLTPVFSTSFSRRLEAVRTMSLPRTSALRASIKFLNHFFRAMCGVGRSSR
jgi:uncharacterized membrane protein